jgi:hypothetical protein
MFSNNFNLNLEKYSYSEQKLIYSILSSFDECSLTHFDKKIKTLVEKRTRGWANFLRRGVAKVHRYHCPKIINWKNLYGTGKQPLLKMFHRFKKHDHQRNELLIKYREMANMRLNIRTERQEVYHALDLALLKFLDVDKFGIGLFEIACSIEMLAKTIGIYRIDKNGHARYDTLLNAVNDYEKSKQIIIYREFDRENKVYRPMRMWLTIEFFTSRGYNEEELRELLKSREHYLHKKGIFVKTREYYQKNFLQRLDKSGVLNPPSALVKKLLRIKNKLCDMHYEKKSIKQVEKQKKRAEKELEQANEKLTYRVLFERFVSSKNISQIEKYLTINKVRSVLDITNDEFWLRCLIESGWQPPS